MSQTTGPSTTPTSLEDPINARILAVSEDKIQGFTPEPFRRIAELTELPLETVLERIAAMLRAGVIRRVRQTLITTSLAPGALVAWKVPNDALQDAFDWVHENDPFTGHAVIRTADPSTAGSGYRLWTTLKVPQGYSLEKHCRLLAQRIGAESFRIMPAKKLFALGVGHIRRRNLVPGQRTEQPGRVLETKVIPLDETQWRVLMALKRELSLEEIRPTPWEGRAAEAGMSPEAFYEAAAKMDELGVIGRFSTFLEHVKKLGDGSSVTRYNALFHWAVPPGKEMEAGKEVGRHVVMTHAYWREGGPEFAHVNIMGVAHGLDKAGVLEHKAAIDRHLEDAGIEVGYTNVFWGGRSEIKPSEIAPQAYRAWCLAQGVEPEAMRLSDA
jgi:DNA-binding Lrp family transcriptional regulator